jgi:hypothetical protein
MLINGWLDNSNTQQIRAMMALDKNQSAHARQPVRQLEVPPASVRA